MTDYQVTIARKGYIVRSARNAPGHLGIMPEEWAFSTAEEVTGWLLDRLKNNTRPPQDGT